MGARDSHGTRTKSLPEIGAFLTAGHPIQWYGNDRGCYPMGRFPTDQERCGEAKRGVQGIATAHLLERN